MQGNKWLPWAENEPAHGTLDRDCRYCFGLPEGPRWAIDSNWTFKGYCYFRKAGLVLDLVLALVFVAAIVAAYDRSARRRWHYSLRVLLGGFLVIGAIFAWWRGAMNRWERERRAVTSPGDKGRMLGGVGMRCDAPLLLRMLMGENQLHPFYHVTYICANKKATEADFAHIGDLSDLEILVCNDTQITDQCLQDIRGLTKLKELYLEGTQISDVGLEQIPNLLQLVQLRLRGTRISDAGLEKIQDLPRLEWLDLSKTEITGAGFRQFKGLPQLRFLSLDDTRVSDDSLKYLAQLPRLKYLNLRRKKSRMRVCNISRNWPNSLYFISIERISPMTVLSVSWSFPISEHSG